MALLCQYADIYILPRLPDIENGGISLPRNIPLLHEIQLGLGYCKIIPKLRKY
jgi:hypothetical protein